MKKALITGITGQDGSYLAELLLSKGYQVHGMIRRSSSFNTGRINDLYRDPHEEDVRLLLHYGDLNDASSINTLLRKVQPDEIYNLGAQSHVRVSFDIPMVDADLLLAERGKRADLNGKAALTVTGAAGFWSPGAENLLPGG